MIYISQSFLSNNKYELASSGPQGKLNGFTSSSFPEFAVRAKGQNLVIYCIKLTTLKNLSKRVNIPMGTELGHYIFKKYYRSFMMGKNDTYVMDKRDLWMLEGVPMYIKR